MMIRSYKSASRLEKIFIWLTVVLGMAIVAVYVINVVEALNMAPDSYNCTSDSMMMQICHDPYGSSVTWTIIQVGFFGWPFFIAWFVLGMAVLTRRSSENDKRQQAQQNRDNEPPREP